MDFHPTLDQRALIDEAFSRPLDALLPIERLHRDGAEEPWGPLAELGVFGVAVPAEQGGVGLSAAEEALLAEQLGSHLAHPQVLATLAAVHCAEETAREAIAAGGVRVAPGLVTGDRLCLIDAAGADLILVRRGGDAALIDAATLNDRADLKDHHWAATLEIATFREPVAWAPAAAALRVRLVEAAALSGIAKAARDMSVAYANLREQFGRPIGAFQAIKHRCADMAAAAMAAGDQVTFAATAIDQDRPDAAFQVEAALLLAIDAALANAGANIQIHGGIGFSDEADPHLLVKRAHLLVELAGGAEAAAERVAAADPPMRR